MNEITIEEVVNFHLKQNSNMTVDQLLSVISDNVIEIAKRDLAEKLKAKCIYSCFTENCNFCGQCIGEEMDSYQDIIDGTEHNEYLQDVYIANQYEIYGHP